MRRLLQALLIALLLPLSSVAPPPDALPLARIRPQDRGAIGVNQLPALPQPQQECTYQIAPNRFREVIYDGRGYPYGEVAGWSCVSAAEALGELERRRDAMQAEALERFPQVAP